MSLKIDYLAARLEKECEVTIKKKDKTIIIAEIHV